MKTLIAVPCMDMVHTVFFVSYSEMRTVGEVSLSCCTSSLIYDSRNRLGEVALKAGADRILWLDSDLALPPDLMERLSADIDSGCDYVAGLVFRRVKPYNPAIFSKVEVENNDGRVSIDVESMKDWPKEQVFEIAGSGFGAVMMTIDLYRRVYEGYGLPFSPMIGLGEDVSFCWRARSLGAKLYCDSRVIPKHMGLKAYDETMYTGGEEA